MLVESKRAPGDQRSPAAAPRNRKPTPSLGSWSWQDSVRRVLDAVLASLLLACCWPILLLAVALVRLTSRGPALYTQIRVGRGGRPFRISKVRTMFHDCERTSGPRWSTAGDPRVLPIGRVLRRTHLDELPQLWNVLCGDMSLVGPRPERPEFVPQLERVLPRYRERLAVAPGVTGLAQVHLPPDTDLESVRRKLALDLIYIQHRSWWLDLRILVATFCKLILPIDLHRLVLPVPAALDALARDAAPLRSLTGGEAR